MTLSELHVHHLRNITNARFSLHPQYNIFTGPNGSGKTSLLEAIYLLGSGHSFRTREITPLLQYEEQKLTVFARTFSNESVSIQKSPFNPTQVKLNKAVCRTSSELAHFLPCQIFYQDIFHIIDTGPAARRSLLDWGLFHVKQNYHAVWKEYRRILKQRNALLRRNAKYNEFVPWDQQLVALASDLDQMRQDYFCQWSERFKHYLHQLTQFTCDMRYFKGWDRKGTGQDLQLLLETQFSADIHRQHTNSGPHNADIIITSNDMTAKHTLSRGQQKIILIALKLAQASLTPKPCIYLMDDIMAELDAHHIESLFCCLKGLQGQFFITSISHSKQIDSYFKGCSETFDLPSIFSSQNTNVTNNACE